MKKLILLCWLCQFFLTGFAQELYPFTEPASNMPAKSLAVRFNVMRMPMNFDTTKNWRFMPEFSIGVNKKLMLHVSLSASNMFQEKIKLESGSLYAKYRFLSNDDIHTHFRMAAFGKVALSNNPTFMQRVTKHILPGNIIHEIFHAHKTDDLTLDGNQSGMQFGIIATQLVHKLAVSASLSHINRWNNLGNKNFFETDARNAMQYSLSAGLLLFPRSYKDYKQTNLNLYVEFLGSNLLDSKGHFLDIAPAVQLIFNSTSKLNLGYRGQIRGNMRRFNNKTYLISYEWQFLNLFKKKNK